MKLFTTIGSVVSKTAETAELGLDVVQHSIKCVDKTLDLYDAGIEMIVNEIEGDD